ncbi:DUF3293 domain-containing protein [Streptomyces sp. CNZ748]|uniref:DUF3293 domain-containing protein n=1 Tax=Streptomyces sp. CNZ748 TaxID=2885160 RepID=UPI0027DED684|nr:DUF3293 domain-containing protein [Streptomyces sp. CNZ748]
MHAVGASHTPRDWHLYRGAVVRIRFEDQSVLVGPRPPGTTEKAFPAAVGDAAVHVITAWNPLGRITPDDVNARAQQRLLDEIRRLGHPWWPAVGGDPRGTYQEESVAVLGLTDATARAWGRRFEQDAVFAWTPDAWRVLACDSDTVTVQGWAASTREPSRDGVTTFPDRRASQTRKRR